MTFQQDLEAYFATYADAFARWDVDAVCAHWAAVGLFVMPAGNVALDAAAFRENVVTLMDFCRRQGVARPEGKLLSCQELFPNVAEARMAYRLFDAAGAEMAAWEHVYLVAQDGSLARGPFYSR